MSKHEILVSIDEEVFSTDPLKARLRCIVEEDGERASLSFSADASPEDIARTLENSAMFLEDDLPIMMDPKRRRQIIEMHRKAAKKVPALKRG